jgi:phytanoyl-CoA hydroxylase
MGVTATSTQTQGELPIVGSNQGKIKRQYIRWLRPTAKDTPMAEMRERLQLDGYLLVKNLLPREDVLKVRKE